MTLETSLQELKAYEGYLQLREANIISRLQTQQQLPLSISVHLASLGTISWTRNIAKIPQPQSVCKRKVAYGLRICPGIIRAAGQSANGVDARVAVSANSDYDAPYVGETANVRHGPMAV